MHIAYQKFKWENVKVLSGPSGLELNETLLMLTVVVFLLCSYKSFRGEVSPFLCQGMPQPTSLNKDLPWYL